MCILALSFDHRIIDGADADRYMADVKESLQKAAFTPIDVATVRLWLGDGGETAFVDVRED